jgi:hypothetical protein
LDLFGAQVVLAAQIENSQFLIIFHSLSSEKTMTVLYTKKTRLVFGI